MSGYEDLDWEALKELNRHTVEPPLPLPPVPTHVEGHND